MPAILFKPTYWESPVRNSGNLGGTGQMLTTQGGGQVSALNVSGLGADTLIASGPGRLDTTLIVNFFQSGRGVIFYDSAVATSGGPFTLSGHKALAIIPPAINAGLALLSGQATGFVPWDGLNKPCGSPFGSGIVAAPWPAGTTASGTHGFSVNFTLAGLTSGGANISSVPGQGQP